MFKVKVTKEFGRGIYATEKIKKGTVIEICELLIFSADQTKLINMTDLKFYTFVLNPIQDCLVLGHGEIFNHSDRSNVSYDVELIDDRATMVFRAKKEIDPGRQLFINYNDDCEGSTNEREYKGQNLMSKAG